MVYHFVLITSSQGDAQITTHFVLMPDRICCILLTNADLKLWNLGMFDVITISRLTFEMTFKKFSGASVLESADGAAADVDIVRGKRLFCQWGKLTADLINMDLGLSRKKIDQWVSNCGTGTYGGTLESSADQTLIFIQFRSLSWKF